MKRTPIMTFALATLLSAALLVPTMAIAAESDMDTDVTAGQSGAGSTPVPVLVISSYDTSSERLVLGKRFKLTLDIRNATARRADNVVVSLGSPSMASAEGASASGLTVLGTGNAKYVGRLRGSSTSAVSFKVVSAPGMQPGAATIPVTIAFEHEGQRHEASYTIGLVFERNANIQVAASEVPVKATVGEPFEASFEVANGSGFALSNASLSVAAEGASVKDGRLFLGAFDDGATEAIDVTIDPKVAGKLEVVLSVAYKGDDGKEQTFVSKQEVNVADIEKAPANPDAEGGKGAEKEKGNWFVRFFKALFGLGE